MLTFDMALVILDVTTEALFGGLAQVGTMRKDQAVEVKYLLIRSRTENPKSLTSSPRPFETWYVNPITAIFWHGSKASADILPREENIRSLLRVYLCG